MKRNLLVFCILWFTITACSSSSAEPGEIEVLPPTDTSPPPIPTDTPDPVLFVDDFDGGIDSVWSWQNEDPDRWMIAPEGWLVISADNPSVLASKQQIQQVNFLTQPSPEGDFVITTRLTADPEENFQQAGIFLINDGENYVSVLTAFCERCLSDSEGHGVVMEAFHSGEPIANKLHMPRDHDQTDVYLRLIYSASQNTVTGSFAISSDNWQEVGLVENVPAFDQVALGAANTPGPEGIQEDLIAFFDYFEISRNETPARIGSSPPEPTPTLEPTPPPTSTPLPQGILFRDDFEGYLQPGWVWVNEEPDRWTFTGDGWLEIIGNNLSFFTEGEDIGITNFLTRDLPPGEFMITAHIKTEPLENFQQAAIYIYQDRSNYVALNIGYCNICPTGGHGFYMETFIDNNPFGDAYHILRNPKDTDVYLRLINQGGSITGYFATSPGEWQRAAAFGNFFDFKLVGLATTNSIPTGVENDIVSLFDYFEISLPE